MIPVRLLMLFDADADLGLLLFVVDALRSAP
jgi:hypothetical protein